MQVRIEESWRSHLQGEFDKPYFATLTQFVRSEYATRQIFPPGRQIFNAFDLCPFDRVKVVIIGQDPYHDDGQANGLCFSVNPGTPFPPSLQNIFKEISDDLGRPMPTDGDLSRWARQGVLLLNATLTVRAHQAGSHQGKGWEQFTDEVIRLINQNSEHVVYLLWGAQARNKCKVVDRSRNLVLESPHPSPLSASRGFFGCHHFSQANAYLMAHGKAPINWQLPQAVAPEELVF